MRNLEYYYFLEKEILEIKNCLNSILSKENLYLLERDFRQVQESIDAGEYVLAFEDLCAIIKDAKVAMPLRFKQKIFTLGTLMDIDEEKWINIQYFNTNDLKK